jgi:hypothetical protein
MSVSTPIDCKKCGVKSIRPAGYRRSVFKIQLLRERDGDNCGICALPIWFEAPSFHHEAAASVDHIIPKGSGKGGCHCLGNLRLCHHWCNWLRADDPPATKLRLRGCAGHMRKVLRSTPLAGMIDS